MDGVGKLAVDAINMRDYPMIQAYVVWMAIIYVLVNLIADLLYRALDPGESAWGGDVMKGRFMRRGAAGEGVPGRSPRRERRKWIVFLILAAALLLAVLFARQLCPWDPYQQDLSRALQPPSAEHLFGTDRYGRDMLSRVIIGSRTSVTSALILVAIISVMGTALGIVVGYLGGVVDGVIMRVSDICLAFPGLVFAMAIAAVLNGGVESAVLALAAVQLAKVRENCQKSDAGFKGRGIHAGRPAFGLQPVPADFPASAAQYRPHSGDRHHGYRHDDDGDRGAVLPGPWEASRLWRSGGSMMSDGRSMLADLSPGWC